MPRSIVRVLISCALGLLSVAAAAEPDPPARVGRASLVEGDVAYLRDGEWIPLPVNWPITTGTRLSAAPGARAEVRIGSTAVRLAGATELEIARLDDDAIGLRLLHGTIDARVRDGDVAREFSVETPEARASLLEPGRYRFDAGIAPDTTAVSADIGAARVDSGGNSFVVHPGKRAEVGRNGDVLVADVRRDAFDEWALARERRDEASRSASYVSPEMTGYESLDEHGDWREVPEYGPVWVPRTVPVGWAPYRTGRWAWVEPWGWTWIDAAPWGFAPFHYGRWAFFGGVWVWAPGRVVARPVYAPALVGWVGRPGWSVSVSIGTVPAVGWFPLAPREVFVPAYRHSPAYVRNVNVAHVTNVTHITNVTNVSYANRRIDRAVTVVPAAAVTLGQPVERAHVHVRRAELDRNAPASPTPPVAAIAPPRPAAPHAARDDREPQRQIGPGPRLQEAPRAEPRDERKQEVRTPPNVAATPSAPPATPPAPATPPRASEQSRPTATDRPQARSTERGPDAPPRVVETRPDPRSEPQRAGQRIEPPRAVAPAAPTPSPVQTQPRAEPRVAGTPPEPRREAQRVEPSRANAPTPQAPPPQVRSEPRPADPRPEPGQELRHVEPPRAVAPAAPTSQPPQPQVRNEPRTAAPRVEPPRSTAPAPSAPPQPQPRHESRASPPAPVVRAAPPAPPAAMPAPQPPPQQSAPRGDGDRGQGREQRRGEGRGAG